MACCRLAAKGRSLADSSYEAEKQTILDFLNMQRPAANDGPTINPNSFDLQTEDYVAPRFLRKLKGKVRIIYLLLINYYIIIIICRIIVFWKRT